MKQKRRKFTVTFKTQVVLEALKERETLQELAKRFELHPNQITQWKRAFMDNAEKAFGENDSPESQVDVDKLYQKIGELEMERDFLKKSLWKTGL